MNGFPQQLVVSREQKIFLSHTMLKNSWELHKNPEDPQFWKNLKKDLDRLGPAYDVEQWMSIWADIISTVRARIQDSPCTSNFQSFHKNVLKFIKLQDHYEKEVANQEKQCQMESNEDDHGPCTDFSDTPKTLSRVAKHILKHIDLTKSPFPQQMNSPKASALISSLEQMFSELTTKLIEGFSKLESQWDAMVEHDQVENDYLVAMLINAIEKGQRVITESENLPMRIAKAIVALTSKKQK